MQKTDCPAMFDPLFFTHLWESFNAFDSNRMHKPPSLTLLAQEIMTHHFGKSPDTHDAGAAARRVHATLMTNLSFFLGEVGGFTLLRRSLRRTEGAFSWLVPLRNAEQSDLVNALGRYLDQQSPDIAKNASIVIFASLLELLAKLIGVQLTLQIVQGTWPNVRISSYMEKSE